MIEPKTALPAATALVLDILAAAGEPLNETELQDIARWIEDARLERDLLTLFERGELRIRWQAGGPVFYARPKATQG